MAYAKIDWKRQPAQHIRFRDVENGKTLPPLDVTDYQLSALIQCGMVEMAGGEPWGVYSRSEVVHYTAEWLS